MSTPHFRCDGAWRWLLPLLALSVWLSLATLGPGRVAHAQASDCQLDDLRGSQGCTLRLGELKRYAMVQPNEQHKWRLDLDSPTNLLVKLYTAGADYELWLYAGDNRTLLAGGSHEEEPIDPFVMRYLQPGTYYVHIRSPRQDPPNLPYVLHASELGRGRPLAAVAAAIGPGNVGGVRSLSLLNERGLPWQVAFSPDGERLAVAVTSLGALGERESVDGTGLMRDYGVKIWDLKAGVERQSLVGGGEASVYSVAFSPDGRWLAAGWGNNAVLWDAASFREVQKFRGHQQEITRLAFSPDSRVLATASLDHQVRLWDIASGAEVGSLVGHTDAVTDLAFSPDGRLLASASADRSAKLWDVASRAELGALAGHTGTVTGVAFAPDGQVLATSSIDGQVKLWDVPGRSELATLASPGRAVGVRFSPDGRVLASSHEPAQGAAETATGDLVYNPEQDGTEIRVWDVATRQPIRSLRPVYTHAALAFSPKGDLLASAGIDRIVALWGVPDASARSRDPNASSNPQVLLSDTFDNPEEGQLPSTASDAAGFVERYVDGEYGIRLLDPSSGQLPIAVLPGTYADAALSVQARIVGDPAGQDLALACRDGGGPDSHNHYRLSVALAGRMFQLSRWDADGVTPLVAWQTEPSIRPAGDWNTLELRCADATITALINGQQVAQVQDPAYRRGSFWIGASGGSSEVRFDNLKVVLQ